LREITPSQSLCPSTSFDAAALRQKIGPGSTAQLPSWDCEPSRLAGSVSAMLGVRPHIGRRRGKLLKVFVSSLISGFEPFRAAARDAVESLGHNAVMAEDFGAKPASPQMACLGGLQSSDVVVLLLGPRYGYPQGSSGVSPTHEEYLEAKATKPIFLYVQEGVEREEAQAKLLADAQSWQGGLFRNSFATPEELRKKIVRDLHEHELANASGPVDPATLRAAAAEMLPRSRNGGGAQRIHVALAPGPIKKVLRPSEIEDPALAKALHRQALFEDPALFDSTKGVQQDIQDGALTLSQDRAARIELRENGAILLSLPLLPNKAGLRDSFSASFAIIQEDVERELANALAFANWLLERVDPSHRLSHVAIAASIEASEHMGWRTRAEQDASPNSGHMRMGGAEPKPAIVDLPRAGLRLEAKRAAEDLVVILKRSRKA